MIVVRTIKITQCAGAMSEVLCYGRTRSGMTEPVELSPSCFFFLSASHSLVRLCTKGSGTSCHCYVTVMLWGLIHF